MESEIQVCVAEINKVYRDGGHTTPQQCSETKHFYWRLGQVCKTFDDFLYVLTNIDFNRTSTRHHKFVRSAISQVETVEHVRGIWPFTPKGWANERRILLRKGADAATSREELYGFFSELEVI